MCGQISVKFYAFVKLWEVFCHLSYALIPSSVPCFFCSGLLSGKRSSIIMNTRSVYLVFKRRSGFCVRFSPKNALGHHTTHYVVNTSIIYHYLLRTSISSKNEPFHLWSSIYPLKKSVFVCVCQNLQIQSLILSNFLVKKLLFCWIFCFKKAWL